MKKLLALLLVLAMAAGMVACSSSKTEKPAETTTTAAAAETTTAAASEATTTAAAATSNSDFKVGVILIGDENEGYTEAHIEGVKAAQKALGLKDDQIIYKYNIPEDETCYDTATDLVEQGCKIIFANSFSHESYMLQAAQENPKVIFCHATGTKARSAKLPNFCNYFNNIYEARYVSGVIAGMKLKELMDAGKVKDPHIGYVGAYPYAEVVSGYTAFFLGIRSIVPDAHMDVQYTNSWFDITAEGEAANALMSKGCVIIGQHADSTGAPSAVEAAFKAGKTVYSVGYNVDMLSVAPDVALTSPQNNWGVLYTEMIKTAMEGGTFKTDYCGGYAEGAVQISKLGTACAKGTQEKVDATIAAIKDGSLHVFDTSTFTVGGKPVTNAFATDTNGDFKNDADEAIIDGYYHESYFQSAPSFSLRIDGITELNAS